MNKKSIVLFSLLLILCLTASVQAHELYDYSCCSNQDCHPISCEDIVEKGKSLFYKGWEFFGQSIKPSKDGSCHVCIANEFSKDFTPVPRCIYVLQGS